MPCLNLICKKLVKNMGAQSNIIAVVGGIINAIIGRATIGIPNPKVPLTKPPANTAEMIIIIIVGSLYIVNLKKICN